VCARVCVCSVCARVCVRESDKCMFVLFMSICMVYLLM